MPQPLSTALTLGNVTFADFEVPQKINEFGIYQALAVHRFPGGYITVQDMGGFPPETIKWSGVLDNYQLNYSGQASTAADVDWNVRYATLAQMAKTGQGVLLSFGAFQYMVVIKSFYASPENIFWVPYNIELVPYDDQTAAASQPAQSQTGLAQIQQQNSNLANTISNAPAPLTAPILQTLSGQAAAAASTASALQSLTSFQQSLSQALQQATGNSGLVNTPALQSSLNSAQSAVDPLISSADSGVAAFALQSSSTLDVINNQLNPTIDTQTTLPGQVNPNLQSLALQYYGDASQWEVIANANEISPITPFPTGIFNLVIPQLTTSAA